MSDAPERLIWSVMTEDPLVYEAKAGGNHEYHVTIADDENIRGQKCHGWRQVWVSDIAPDYDTAKRLCEEHFEESKT